MDPDCFPEAMTCDALEYDDAIVQTTATYFTTLLSEELEESDMQFDSNCAHWSGVGLENGMQILGDSIPSTSQVTVDSVTRSPVRAENSPPNSKARTRRKSKSPIQNTLKITKTKGVNKTRSLSGHSLACPYYKGDPDGYPKCSKIERKDLAGIKEHLKRNHKHQMPRKGDLVGLRSWSTLFQACFPEWDNPVPFERELHLTNILPETHDANLRVSEISEFDPAEVGRIRAAQRASANPT